MSTTTHALEPGSGETYTFKGQGPAFDCGTFLPLGSHHTRRPKQRICPHNASCSAAWGVPKDHTRSTTWPNPRYRPHPVQTAGNHVVHHVQKHLVQDLASGILERL